MQQNAILKTKHIELKHHSNNEANFFPTNYNFEANFN